MRMLFIHHSSATQKAAVSGASWSCVGALRMMKTDAGAAVDSAPVFPKCRPSKGAAEARFAVRRCRAEGKSDRGAAAKVLVGGSADRGLPPGTVDSEHRGAGKAEPERNEKMGELEMTGCLIDCGETAEVLGKTIRPGTLHDAP
jgi:hypothetical protein